MTQITVTNSPTPLTRADIKGSTEKGSVLRKGIMSTEVLENDEDTVEYRVIAYMDFVYITACKFLKGYASQYGFDAQSVAQDITQTVVMNTLESNDAYGPALGAQWFKTACENRCQKFLRSVGRERKYLNSWGEMNPQVESHEVDGYLDLSAAVRGLPEAQRWAIADSYFDDGVLPEFSNPNAIRQTKHRAKVQLVKKGFSRAT